MERYLLDTSALFTLRYNEEGSDQVTKILKEAQSERCVAYISFMTLMEIFYWIYKKEGKGTALQTLLEIKTLPIQRVDLSDAILVGAGELKANYSISLADSWIAATAINKEATLVHKDPEFDQLKGRLPLKSLPYK